MIWPAAALAALLLGFVVFYGSALQGRLAAGAHAPAPDDAAEGEPTL
ncbi:MAG TPA: hypothetical protein VLA22_01050 [Gaiellaceae bacterium]|nr:hypothetical protein [Gaiellaceae bacterium]